MTLEQETASIIAFVLAAAGNPTPYYHEMKEDFAVPSCYFPSPEIVSSGDTLSSFNLRYSIFIKAFHKTTEDAYAMARDVLCALQANRNLVPLLNPDGGRSREGLRIRDSEIKRVDSGVYQISIEWDSRRPYSRDDESYMQEYDVTYKQGGNSNG